MIDLLETIGEAWGWLGLDPKELIASNAFGNVIVRGSDGRYWRICPEELAATCLASSDEELARVRADPEFVQDWEMAALVSLAETMVGPLSDGHRFCLKIPSVLGGAYAAENLGMISISELISFSGDLAKQIRDLPDGSKLRLNIVD